MSLRSALLAIILSASLLSATHGLCETELSSMQKCLTESVTDGAATVDAEACVDCLGQQTPETTALDCNVNYDFVCTLADVCQETCGSSCNSQIEAFGFCTSETFFQGCPQDCSSPPDSGTPDKLQNQTCSVFFNAVVSCLSANSGNSDAAASTSESCGACVDANPPPSNGDCSAANDYACSVASSCYQDCGSVCNDELFTFLQCQGDNLTGEQCTYDACDDAGNPTTGESGSTRMILQISTLIGTLAIGLLCL